MSVATVAIVDTNADPNVVDYPIPANDDAVGSLQLIIGYIMDAWAEGRNQIKNDKPASPAGGSNLKSEKLETKEIDNKGKEPKTKDKPKPEKKIKVKSEKKVKTSKK